MEERRWGKAAAAAIGDASPSPRVLLAPRCTVLFDCSFPCFDLWFFYCSPGWVYLVG
jgi:hypothetical protein